MVPQKPNSEKIKMPNDIPPEMLKKIQSLSDREKKLVMLALELQERLNKATDVALHYHPCVDKNKSCNDHIDEVHAYLRHNREMKPEKYYNDVEEILGGMKI